MSKCLFRGYIGLPGDPVPNLSSNDIVYLEQTPATATMAEMQAAYRANPGGFQLYTQNQVTLGTLSISGAPSGSVASGQTITLNYQTNLTDTDLSVEWFRKHTGDSTTQVVGGAMSLNIVVDSSTPEYEYRIRLKNGSGKVLITSAAITLTVGGGNYILAVASGFTQPPWVIMLGFTRNNGTHETSLHLKTLNDEGVKVLVANTSGTAVAGAAWPAIFHSPDTQYALPGYTCAIRLNPTQNGVGGLIGGQQYSLQIQRLSNPNDIFQYDFLVYAATTVDVQNFQLPSDTTTGGGGTPGYEPEGRTPGTLDAPMDTTSDMEGTPNEGEQVPVSI